MSIAADFIKFINAAPSPYHAVEECSRLLLSAGFTKLAETQIWNLQHNGKYFFTRDKTTLFAFAVGGQYKGGNGFNLIGAHTDSPVLKVKPHSATSAAGFLQVGVEAYGGGLWHTWFDRDLSLAGLVVHRNGNALLQSLVRINKPILRIPNLAIHLDRSVREQGFKFNEQTHLLPLLATSAKAQLEAEVKSSSNDHHPLLLHLLSKELNCNSDDIVDFELSLYDTQPSVIGGACDEFIFSPRLDNLLSSYCSVRSLIDSSGENSTLKDEKNIRGVLLFDNEEIGSLSDRGAASTMMQNFLQRVSASFDSSVPSSNLFEISTRKSFLISADMAHACHPNYMEKHEPLHRPELHKGPVLKKNANQRYATTAVTSALLKELAKRNNVPLQEFVVRNDSACGSTIGPILSGFGVRTVDIGNPQLSMHSIREMCGTDDVEFLAKLFRGFFDHFTDLDTTVE